MSPKSKVHSGYRAGGRHDRPVRRGGGRGVRQAGLCLGRRHGARADRLGRVLQRAAEGMRRVQQRAARRRAHHQGLEGPGARQQVGQRQHHADDRHGSLGRGREVVLSGRRQGRLRGLRAAQAPHADAGRLAARGAADHRGARQEGRRPRRAHGQDRQGRLRPRQPGGAGPALVGDRLPLRQAPVAEQSEHLGLARRSAPDRSPPPLRRADNRNYASPVTSPPLPVPRPGSRAAGSPPRAGRTLFAA